MSNPTKLLLEETFIQKANEDIARDLQLSVQENKQELLKLRRKLSVTYWIIISLSVIMFILGVILISIPAIAAFSNQIGELDSIIAAGFGLADLAALFFFRPLFKIHNLMGDMSQITLALNSYQIQVGLRLMEMETNDRASVGKAASDIKSAALNSIELVQKYFEMRDLKK